MRASLTGAVAWLLLGCLSLVPVVRADAASGEVAKLVDEGLALRTKGRDAEALQRFQAAYEQSKEPRTLAQIALAEQALGRWDQAHAHLSEALSQRDDPWIVQRRGALDGALKRIESELGSVVVTSNVAGASVTVGGRAVGRTPLPQPVRAAPGKVTVRVQATGYSAFEQAVNVARGKQARVGAELKAEPPPAAATAAAPAPPPAAEPTPELTEQEAAEVASPAVTSNDVASHRSPDDQPGWKRPSVLLGIAGAGLSSAIASAVTYGIAGKKTRSLEKDCYSEVACDGDERTDRRGTVKKIERTSAVLLGLGLAAMVGSGGAYLFSRYAAGQRDSAEAPVTLEAAFDRSSASLLGTMEF